MSKRIIVHAATEAVDRFWAYVDSVTTEIGGIGYVRREPSGALYWHKTVLLPQHADGGSFDFDDPCDMIQKAHDDGVLGDPSFVWLWWHSHVSMGTFWSSTDTDEFIAPFRDAGAPALISIVGNHRHEYKMRLDVFDHDLAPHITLENVDFLTEYDSALADEVAAEVKQLVKPKKAAPAKVYNMKPAGSGVRSFDQQAWDLNDEDIDSLGMQFGLQTPLSQDERAELYEAFGPGGDNPYGQATYDADPHITFTSPSGEAERLSLKEIADRKAARDEPLSAETAERIAVQG